MTKDISSTQSPLVIFLIEKRYRIHRHLLIWAYLFLTEFSEPLVPAEFADGYTIYYKFANLISFSLLVYLNMYLLVPKLLFKEKYFQYILILISMIVLFHVCIETFFQNNFQAYRAFKAQESSGIFRDIIEHTNLWVTVVLSSTSIKMFQRGRKDAVRMSNLEKSSLEAELGELKNQLNPHFLFNMLNNVNTLVFTEPKIASVIIIKLSGFLRYLLYENNKKEVALQSEIKFLTNFLELESIRREEFSFSITNNCPEKIAPLVVPPNLFLIFVENAAKHSRGSNDHSNVNISFELSNNRLLFICQNSKSQITSHRQEPGGLGLANIRRRLDLLYKNNYALAINETIESYKVTLNIPL